MYFQQDKTVCALNLLSEPKHPKQKDGLTQSSGLTMYTYAYLAIVHLENVSPIASYDDAKYESMIRSPCSLTGKTNPTHLSVCASYSTREITRVASSPIVTSPDKLYLLMCF